MQVCPLNLEPNLTDGARITQTERGEWRLEIPSGPAGRYRLAQLDDYRILSRDAFRWRPPASITLRARVSTANVPGTWGFGLWNDPFAMGILTGVKGLRLPALPKAAWFFYASEGSYLSLRDDLPANGWTGAVFQSPDWPPLALGLGLPAVPLLALPPAVRLLRRLAGRIIRQDAVSIAADPTEWRTYGLQWDQAGVRMQVNGEVVLDSAFSPNGPLGLVLWIDNQYAAIQPSGRLRYGMHENPEAVFLEIGDIHGIEG